MELKCRYFELIIKVPVLIAIVSLIAAYMGIDASLIK